MITGTGITLVVASYLLGCLTAGYYWVRWRTGKDLRQEGSGSLGARNVGRLTGASGFVLTFLLDFGKGALAVAAARYLHEPAGTEAAVLWAVVAGHVWPVQLRFQGGKGIAASLGAIAVYDPFLLVCLGALFSPLIVVLRSFTFSGLVAFAFLPLVTFLSGLENWKVAAMSFLALIVLISHRRNLREEVARLANERPVKQTSGSRQRKAML